MQNLFDVIYFLCFPALIIKSLALMCEYSTRRMSIYLPTRITQGAIHDLKVLYNLRLFELNETSASQREC
jgi:hypothetical protein